MRSKQLNRSKERGVSRHPGRSKPNRSGFLTSWPRSKAVEKLNCLLERRHVIISKHTGTFGSAPPFETINLPHDEGNLQKEVDALGHMHMSAPSGLLGEEEAITSIPAI